MKKYAQISMLLFMTFFLTTVASAQKFGYLNSQALLAEMPEVKQAQANLEALQKQLQKKGQKMLEDYQLKVQSIAKKEQAGEYSPKQLEEEAKKIRDEESSIAKFEQDMQKQMMDKEKQLLQPILDRINTAIGDVARENGYQFIFDASTGILLHADESQNVSSLVKTKLGI